MKRRLCVLILAGTLVIPGVPALAAGEEIITQTTADAEEVADDTSALAEIQALSCYDAEEEEDGLLTLEDAVQRVLRNSTELKKSATSLDLLEDQVALAGISLTYSSEGSDLSDAANLVSQQISLQNSRLSQQEQEEVLAFSTEQAYADLILREREIDVAEASLALAQQELNIARIQQEMGQISTQEYEAQQRSFAQSQTELQQQKSELEQSYIAFNLSMGLDVDTRYSLELPVTYEAYELEIPLESYVTSKASGLSSIRRAKKTLEATRVTTNATKATGTEVGSYAQAEAEYSSAVMDLDDSLEAAEQSIRTAYYDLMNAQTTIEQQIEALAALEQSLETAELQLEMGQTSVLSVEEARQNIAEAQVQLLSALYTYDQKKTQFENPDLL